MEGANGGGATRVLVLSSVERAFGSTRIGVGFDGATASELLRWLKLLTRSFTDIERRGDTERLGAGALLSEGELSPDLGPFKAAIRLAMAGETARGGIARQRASARANLRS